MQQLFIIIVTQCAGKLQRNHKKNDNFTSQTLRLWVDGCYCSLTARANHSRKDFYVVELYSLLFQACFLLIRLCAHRIHQLLLFVMSWWV